MCDTTIDGRVYVDFGAGADLKTSLARYGPFESLNLLKPLDGETAANLVYELDISKDASVIAQLVYFQKYFEKYLPEVAQAVEEKAIEGHHQYLSEGHSLPFSVRKFSFPERKIIYHGLESMQFTHGCGGKCDFCAVDAVTGVRDRVPLDHQLALIEEAKEHVQINPRLYFANDGLEMFETLSEYKALIEKYGSTFYRDLALRTSIPPGTEGLYRELLNYRGWSRIGVSLSEKNVPRLKKAGIVKIDSLRDIHFWNPDHPQHGGIDLVAEPELRKEIFCRGLAPDSVSLKYEECLKNAGLERYDLEGRNYSPYGFSGTIIAPYGVYNIMDAFRASQRYPQGHIVVALDSLDGDPIQARNGDRIENYLQHTVITEKIGTPGRVRTYQLENLGSKAIVKVDTQGIVQDWESLDK